MKSFISSLAIAASLVGFLPAASAATFGSVYFFDEKRAEYNPSHKTITEAVIDHSIDPEVNRVQEQVIDGVRQPVYVNFDHNMNAVEHHCFSRKLADGEDATACGYKPGKIRVFPTISKGF